MGDLVQLEFQGRVATMTLNRPASRNALSEDMLREMLAAVGALAGRRGVSVMILTGAGPAFCAGMDLRAALADEGAPGRLLHLLADFTLRLRTLPQATVASVNGAAIGGGCGIACVCDLAVTHPDAKLGYPEVDLGVCPAVVAPWLVKKIGAGRARRVLLSGGTMTGREAWDLGIVDHLAPAAADLAQATRVLADRLAGAGPLAMLATKELLNRLDHSLDEHAVGAGADLSAAILASPETRAILRARLGG
jgi:methylglutaconyl-CoA hydratase